LELLWCELLLYTLKVHGCIGLISKRNIIVYLCYVTCLSLDWKLFIFVFIGLNLVFLLTGLTELLIDYEWIIVDLEKGLVG
jgi:hypothetical protein